MELLRSLVFSQPHAGPVTLETDIKDKESFSHASEHHSIRHMKQEEEEDPLAVLRALRSTHDILPHDIRSIGGETLEEQIENSRANAAAAMSTNSSITVTVLDAPSAISPSRVSTTRTTTTSTALPFVPIPLGGPRSAEHIALLYQICQKRAIQPEFVFEQHGIKHRASLILGNVLLQPEDGRTYGTKKEAKEVLAKNGVELVRQWEEEDEIKQRDIDLRAGEEGSGEDGVMGQSQAKEVKDTETQENSVGLLLEYTQAHTLPEPIYQPYQLNTHTFACTATLRHHPDPSIPSTFGSPSTPFASKKTAKATSARQVIRWLRSSGHLGASGTPPPRKKARHSLDALANIINPNSNIETASTTDGHTTAPTLDFPTTATAAHQVHTLSHYLGLQSPEYRFSVDPDENFLYSGAAWFVGATGALEGPLGMVEGVFGKKAAREECAKEAARVLRAEIARRGRLCGEWSVGTDF